MGDLERTSAAIPALATSGPGSETRGNGGRRVLAHLFQREIRDLGDSWRFRAMGIMIVVWMAASGLSHADRHLATATAGATLAAAAPAGGPAANAEPTLKAWISIPHSASKPPWKLSFLADSRQNRAPDVYLATLVLTETHLWTRRNDSDQLLHRTEPNDLLFLLRVIVSMAAFVLGYDMVCGHRQRSLLRMTLSYAVGRGRVLLAKWLALWTCLALPFLLGAAASLAILSIHGGMRFSGGELVKIAGVAVIALWGAAFFALLAIFVSTLVREPSHSLAMLTLVWVTMVVVLPEAGGLLAQTLRPLATDQEVEAEIDSIRGDIQDDAGGTGGQRTPEIARLDDYAVERDRARIQNLIYLEQEKRLREVALERLGRERLARDLGMVSPVLLLQDLAERFIGSGLARDRRFVERAWAYGDDLAAWALERDRGAQLLRDIRPARREDGRHIRFEPDFVSEEPLDLTQVPKFEFPEQTILAGLGSAAPRIAFLAILTAILTAAVRISFNYYDVGGTR